MSIEHSFAADLHSIVEITCTYRETFLQMIDVHRVFRDKETFAMSELTVVRCRVNAGFTYRHTNLY